MDFVSHPHDQTEQDRVNELKRLIAYYEGKSENKNHNNDDDDTAASSLVEEGTLHALERLVSEVRAKRVEASRVRMMCDSLSAELDNKRRSVDDLRTDLDQSELTLRRLQEREIDGYIDGGSEENVVCVGTVAMVDVMCGPDERVHVEGNNNENGRQQQVTTPNAAYRQHVNGDTENDTDDDLLAGTLSSLPREVGLKDGSLFLDTPTNTPNTSQRPGLCERNKNTMMTSNVASSKLNNNKMKIQSASTIFKNNNSSTFNKSSTMTMNVRKPADSVNNQIQNRHLSAQPKYPSVPARADALKCITKATTATTASHHASSSSEAPAPTSSVPNRRASNDFDDDDLQLVHRRDNDAVTDCEVDDDMSEFDDFKIVTVLQKQSPSVITRANLEALRNLQRRAVTSTSTTTDNALLGSFGSCFNAREAQGVFVESFYRLTSLCGGGLPPPPLNLLSNKHKEDRLRIKDEIRRDIVQMMMAYTHGMKRAAVSTAAARNVVKELMIHAESLLDYV
eukprot:PhM_4_TR12822/c0_g1_i1/m.17597